ncbi:MAG: hypothetical protein JW966_08315 [Anaerolineae bacterium]|nr:hypothetical protein [Anaerolineae bacterium]
MPLDGYVIDIVQENRLVEIQTGNFAVLKRKLAVLAEHYPVRVVYPVPREKWIVRLDDDNRTPISRRRSPKRGAVVHLFAELVYFPALVMAPQISLEVLLIQEDEIRYYDNKRGWRRKGWVIHERRLLGVVGRQVFESPRDLLALVPPALAEPFTTADLAAALGQKVRLAQQMAYCLRTMGMLSPVGKRGNAVLYIRGISGGNDGVE